MPKVLKNLKYTKDHEWVMCDNDIAVVGITDFAANELGDIVFVEVESLNETVLQHDVFGTVEAVKTVSDLFSPVSGEIIEVNLALNDNPEVITNSPYGDGWIVKIKMSNQEEINSLLSAEEYLAITSGEIE